MGPESIAQKYPDVKEEQEVHDLVQVVPEELCFPDVRLRLRHKSGGLAFWLDLGVGIIYLRRIGVSDGLLFGRYLSEVLSHCDKC